MGHRPSCVPVVSNCEFDIAEVRRMHACHVTLIRRVGPFTDSPQIGSFVTEAMDKPGEASAPAAAPVASSSAQTDAVRTFKAVDDDADYDTNRIANSLEQHSAMLELHSTLLRQVLARLDTLAESSKAVDRRQSCERRRASELSSQPGATSLPQRPTGWRGGGGAPP
eukprot:2803974-Prymnesium_polylepis.1